MDNELFVYTATPLIFLWVSDSKLAKMLHPGLDKDEVVVIVELDVGVVSVITTISSFNLLINIYNSAVLFGNESPFVHHDLVIPCLIISIIISLPFTHILISLLLIVILMIYTNHNTVQTFHDLHQS